MGYKALVVNRVNHDDPSNIGVINKLEGQVGGFKYCGIETDRIYHRNTGIYINERCLHQWKSQKPGISEKWHFFSALNKPELLDYDIYVIRYGLATYPMLRWLREIRNTNEHAIILLDMPTYPYEEEWKGLYGIVALEVDRILRKELAHYVDYILHSGSEKQIFDIKTVRMTNGVNIDRIPIRVPEEGNTGIRLIALGKWSYWHGIDRILDGMSEYVREGGKDLFLDIVGVGPASGDIEKSISDNNLNDYVIIHGVVQGPALDELINRSDLGIGTLGLHRKGVSLDSSLKHREYTARGLPFIMAGQDADDLHEQPFTYVISADDTPVDIATIRDYAYQNSRNDVVRLMRRYASEHLTWKHKMNQLLKKIGILK